MGKARSSFCHRRNEKSKEVSSCKKRRTMTEPKWIQLKKDLKVTAARNPDGNVWQMALPFLENGGVLRIEASGAGGYSGKFILRGSAHGGLLLPPDPQRG